MSTWVVTMEYLREEDPLAFWILEVCAYFHHQDIPVDFIRIAIEMKEQTSNEKLKSDSPPDIDEDNGLVRGDSNGINSTTDSSEEEEDNEDVMLAAIRRLSHFSFLRMRTAEAGQDSFGIHKLVHEAVRNTERQLRLNKNISSVARISLEVLALEFPNGVHGTWRTCERYLQHATLLCSWPESQYEIGLVVSILISVARYFHTQGRYDSAEEILTDLLKVRKELGGPESIAVLEIIRDLAITKVAQGHYHEAELMYKQALEINRTIFGDENEGMLFLSGGLIAMYVMQYRYDEAEELAVRVFKLQEKALGAKDIRTLRTMYDLTSIFIGQEQYDKAEAFLVHTIKLHKEVYGEKNANTIWCMANLAMIYERRGQLEQAEEMYLRVLDFEREVLGGSDPSAMHTLNNLGTIYYRQGRLDKAISTFLSALKLNKELHCDGHPLSVEVLRVLALLHRRLNQYEEVSKFEAEADAMEEKIKSDEARRLAWIGQSTDATDAILSRRSPRPSHLVGSRSDTFRHLRPTGHLTPNSF